MSSHATAEVLSAYLDQQLVEREARQLEEHLGTCPECHVRLESLRKVVQSLHNLTQIEPPLTLQATVARRIALTDESPTLLDRFEEGMSLLNRQNPILAMFGVVIALVLFIYLFSYTLHLRNERLAGTIPVIFQDPPAVAAAGETAHQRTVAGRTLALIEEDLWVEQGVSAEAVSRVILINSAEGRAFLALHPDLSDLAELGQSLVLAVEGEVVRLD